MRRRAALLGALVVLVALAGSVLAAPAVSAQGDARLVIRSVDATAYPQVAVDVMTVGATPAPEELSVTQNGTEPADLVVQPLSATGRLVGTVFVVDSSAAMEEQGALDRAKVAIDEYLLNATPGDRFGLVAVSGEPRVVVDLTSNPNLIRDGLDGLVPAGERAQMVDGVQVGLNLFDDAPGVQQNLAVITGSADRESQLAFDTVRGDVIATAAAVFGIGIPLPGFDGSAVAGLANASSGGYVEVENADAVAAALRQVQAAVQGQQLLVYTGDPEAETIDLTVSAGGLRDSASVPASGVSEGAALNPAAATGVVGAPGFLSSTAAKVLGALLALVAVSLLVYSLGRIFIRDDSSLESMLAPYGGAAYGAPPPQGESVEREHDGSLAQTSVMKRAVELTTEFAERQGLLPRVERMLEKADLPLRAGEALFFYVAIVFVVTALGFVISRDLLITLVVLIVVALLPPAILSQLASRRQKAFLAQLPDTLQLLAGSLKAGYSLMQGIEAVAQQVDDPMGRELRRVIVESRLGRTPEDAMEDSARRMGSADYAWAVMAIRIQREVGGNLAELLLTVADTMTQRERLRRDVKSLTAEGRISAIVLGILPFVLGALMYALNPDYVSVLFDRRLGQLMLVGALLLMLVGFYWMKKTIEIEV